MHTVSIEQPPKDYYSWVECLKQLKTGIPNTGAFDVLRKGKCPEYAGIKASLHGLIEETVNAIIANCVKTLKRDVSKYIDINETDGIHIAFFRFGKYIDGCMFFTEMTFLDQSYCDDLRRETIKHVTRFWSEMLHTLKKDIAAKNNFRMNEELFLIYRVKLLKAYRFSE